MKGISSGERKNLCKNLSQILLIFIRCTVLSFIESAVIGTKQNEYHLWFMLQDTAPQTYQPFTGGMSIDAAVADFPGILRIFFGQIFGKAVRVSNVFQYTVSISQTVSKADDFHFCICHMFSTPIAWFCLDCKGLGSVCQSLEKRLEMAERNCFLYPRLT